MMRIPESCAECLYDKQRRLTDNKEYLNEIKSILKKRKEEDTSPYMVYLFNRVYEKYFGRPASYREEKKKYNDLMLSMEDALRKSIETSENPLMQALAYARAGNYIDFGAMNVVEEDKLFFLLDKAKIHDRDIDATNSFLKQCETAGSFLLLADNCGEIVLDKLFLEQLGRRFPLLKIRVMVRGGEVLNDVTKEDAEYIGLDNYAEIITNGLPVGGTIYAMLPEHAKRIMDEADVILAKGQGNYESLSHCGKHIFYAFLCKCDLFTSRFHVPKYTGIFIEELKNLANGAEGVLRPPTPAG